MERLRPVILIVEDEFLLRMHSAGVIENAPAFEVIQAGNADEAIAILKARPDIHVVFTDIQMRPGCRSIGIKNLCFSLTRCCIPGPSSIIRKKF
jgi:DNA-binding NarL/FixJ family response regulator